MYGIGSASPIGPEGIIILWGLAEKGPGGKWAWGVGGGILVVGVVSGGKCCDTGPIQAPSALTLTTVLPSHARAKST